MFYRCMRVFPVLMYSLIFSVASFSGLKISGNSCKSFNCIFFFFTEVSAFIFSQMWNGILWGFSTDSFRDRKLSSAKLIFFSGLLFKYEFLFGTSKAMTIYLRSNQCSFDLDRREGELYSSNGIAFNVHVHFSFTNCKIFM